MTVKTDWGLPDIERATHDPFADDDPTAGYRIDLRSPETAMRDLFRAEGKLADAGTECDLKWNGQACSTCQVRCYDEETPMGSLCAIGLQQEEIIKATG